MEEVVGSEAVEFFDDDGELGGEVVGESGEGGGKVGVERVRDEVIGD